MKRFRMECGCCYNGYDFKVGYKYLTVYNIVSGKITYKIKLDNSVIKALKDIREKYEFYDARRTYYVMDLAYDIAENERLKERIKEHSLMAVYNGSYKYTCK